MNTQQIETALARTPGFLGVFASDRVPPITSTPSPQCLIVNLDPSWKRGSHWIAVCIYRQHTQKRVMELFDSYGTKPKLSNNDWSVKYNKIKFQSDRAKTCGHYCIYFVFQRLRKEYSFEKIVNTLHQQKNPDRFVKKFVTDLPLGRNQNCQCPQYQSCSWVIKKKNVTDLK